MEFQNEVHRHRGDVSESERVETDVNGSWMVSWDSSPPEVTDGLLRSITEPNNVS